MRTLGGYAEENGTVAKRDIYLSDDLEQRVRASGVKVSPLCQPVIGYAVLHGQEAAEDALRQLLSNGHEAAAIDHHQVVDLEQLARLEELATAHQEALEQLAVQLDAIEQHQARGRRAGAPAWVTTLTAFTVLSLALARAAVYFTATSSATV
jgi:hypothetical protein